MVAEEVEVEFVVWRPCQYGRNWTTTCDSHWSSERHISYTLRAEEYVSQWVSSWTTFTNKRFTEGFASTDCQKYGKYSGVPDPLSFQMTIIVIFGVLLAFVSSGDSVGCSTRGEGLDRHECKYSWNAKSRAITATKIREREDLERKRTRAILAHYCRARGGHEKGEGEKWMRTTYALPAIAVSEKQRFGCRTTSLSSPPSYAWPWLRSTTFQPFWRRRCISKALIKVFVSIKQRIFATRPRTICSGALTMLNSSRRTEDTTTRIQRYSHILLL